MCHNKKYKSINSGIILRLLFGAYCIALFLVLFVRKRFNIGDEPYWEQVKMSINLVPFRTIYGSVYIIVHRTNPYLILMRLSVFWGTSLYSCRLVISFRDCLRNTGCSSSLSCLLLWFCYPLRQFKF